MVSGQGFNRNIVFRPYYILLSSMFTLVGLFFLLVRMYGLLNLFVLMKLCCDGDSD